MEITEIRVFLKEGQDRKLKAYTTITFDKSFVVRNIKIIQGSQGLFVAMPSRKVKRVCSRCSSKNEINSKYCSQCGDQVKSQSKSDDFSQDNKSEHRDIAHPITREFREYLQEQILEAYEKELANPGHPSSRIDVQGELSATYEN